MCCGTTRGRANTAVHRLQPPRAVLRTSRATTPRRSQRFVPAQPLRPTGYYGLNIRVDQGTVSSAATRHARRNRRRVRRAAPTGSLGAANHGERPVRDALHPARRCRGDRLRRRFEGARCRAASGVVAPDLATPLREPRVSGGERTELGGRPQTLHAARPRNLPRCRSRAASRALRRPGPANVAYRPRSLVGPHGRRAGRGPAVPPPSRAGRTCSPAGRARAGRPATADAAAATRAASPRGQRRRTAPGRRTAISGDGAARGAARTSSSEGAPLVPIAGDAAGRGRRVLLAGRVRVRPDAARRASGVNAAGRDARRCARGPRAGIARRVRRGCGAAARPSPPEPPSAPILRVETTMHSALVRRIVVDPQRNRLDLRRRRQDDPHLAAAARAARARAALPDRRRLRRPDLRAGALPRRPDDRRRRLDRLGVGPAGRGLPLRRRVRRARAAPRRFSRRHRRARLFEGRPPSRGGLARRRRPRDPADERLRRRSRATPSTGTRSSAPTSAPTARSRSRRSTARCDSTIRDFRLLGRKRTAPGAKPLTVRFSPDGRELAVSFHDVAGARRARGRPTFARVHARHHAAPRPHAPDRGRVVGRRRDALRLRRLLRPGRARSCAGASGGRGPMERSPAARQRIADLQPLPGGGVAFAAEDPAIGVLDAAGQARALPRPGARRFSAPAIRLLKVSRDAARVQFALAAAARGRCASRSSRASYCAGAAPAPSSPAR